MGSAWTNCYATTLSPAKQECLQDLLAQTIGSRLTQDGARMVAGQDLPPKPRAPPVRSEDWLVRTVSSSESHPARRANRSAVSPEGERREHGTERSELCLTAGEFDGKECRSDHEPHEHIARPRITPELSRPVAGRRTRASVAHSTWPTPRHGVGLNELLGPCGAFLCMNEQTFFKGQKICLRCGRL